jgi:hypothetical protein
LRFVAIVVPLIPLLLFALTFGETKGPEWLVWVARVGCVVFVPVIWQLVSRPRLHELRRRNGTVPDEPPPPPEPADEIERESVSGLWVGMILMTVFVGLFVTVPLVGTPTDGNYWSKFIAIPVIGAFCLAFATAVVWKNLKELARRGAWVPPGAERYPIRVAVATAAVLIATTVHAMLTLLWVVKLCWPASE